jgi:hypothetical protein
MSDLHLTDWRGIEYGEGSLILYAVSRGSSSAFVTEARVVTVLEPEGEGWFEKGCRIRVQPTRTSGYGKPPFRQVTLTNLSPVTVLEP